MRETKNLSRTFLKIKKIQPHLSKKVQASTIEVPNSTAP